MAERDRPSRIVLVADDNQQILRVVTRVLEIDGWTVLEASDGTETMAVIAQATLDLCVMDARMPGAPLDVRLAELERAQPSAGIIVWSGFDVVGDVPERVVVLRKPVDLDDLRAGIVRACSAATRSS